MSKNTNINKSIKAVHIAGGDLKWVIRLPDTFSVKDTTPLQLVSESSGRTIECPVLNIQKDDNAGKLIALDISPLKDTVENCKTEKWRAFLCDYPLKDNNCYISENKKDPFRIRFDLIEEPVGSFEYQGRTVEIIPLCDIDGNWFINVADKCLRYMSAFKCIGLDAGFKHNKVFFKIDCPVLDDFKPKGIEVCYKYQLEKDRRDYFFPFKKIQIESGHLITESEVELDNIAFQALFWDVRMVFDKNGEDFWANVKSPGLSKKASRRGGRRARLRNLVRKQAVRTKNGYYLSISDTPYNNTTILVQSESPYSGIGFRLKERLALFIYGLMRRSLEKKKIFLVHEKFCSAAQDNGFFFFKYCMENDMEHVMQRSIFYVIDKEQPDYAKLKPYEDHVIQFMSLKHMIYSLAARLIISSESKLHSYAWRSSESIIRPRILDSKRLVFLQHGVIGLKRVDAFKKGLPADADMFITSNDMERGFIINELGYPPEEVVVTGLSRWDVLEDKPADTGKKTILVMPTWRKWLDETSEEFFLESEYYLKYMELMNAPELAEILIKHDLHLDFYIHPKLSELLNRFSTDNERIRLIPFGSEPLNELMMECRMLITDYSSVCWDVYYMRKPVLFYQFDLAEYNDTQGAYMDLEKDLFGDRAETKDKLLELLEDAAQSDFELKSKYVKMREGMYKYIDHNNSKRICEEIIKRKW